MKEIYFIVLCLMLKPNSQTSCLRDPSGECIFPTLFISFILTIKI